MLAFYSYFTWVDEVGESHQLSGFDSRLNRIGSEDTRDCAGRWAGGECVCESHPWTGMIAQSAIIKQWGDGYPNRYELRLAGLVDLYERAEQYQLRELTLGGEPVDVPARIAELQALPPGTIIYAKEWDQS